MAKIIESIPNISEGRNKEVIEACVDQIRNTPGCTLLDYSSDETHNRSVITYMGSPEACEEASVKLAKKAVELIDLTKHEGGHPRMGCVDVMPFVPIKEATTEDCIELSKKVGERIAAEADLPVFLYEDSATAKHSPDFGGQRIHPTGGVVAVGARPPLIAFNINLATDNVEIAKNIANIIREVKGGFKCVKAMGLLLEERNVAQVSINMTNFNITPLHRVLELVRREAARYGVNVIGTEVIGLAPMKAFFDAAEYYLQIEDFDPDVQVIENHLL